ncbi:MAG: sugar phosphate isomerase/epimerase [Planctomycetota bacterium]|nr:sugar phosphate isomerase/epimerase [Planctomycetota bacterium]
MKPRQITLLGLLTVALLATTSVRLTAGDTQSLFDRKNIVAWCIVPFDSVKRDPAQRAEMVQKLGITKVAYDWRAEHVPQFEQEILEYQKHGIEFFAFWTMHEEALKLFAKYNMHPQLWVMLRVAGERQDEKVKNASEALLPVLQKAKEIGSKVGIYNHGGWGGEPENMVAVCEYLRKNRSIENVGIVYNQHHGHSHVDRFPAVLAAMEPYLLCLNLDGMVRDGDQHGKKIQPLGQGELDLSLLKIIAASGYRGPIGIIGHTNDDVELRLRDNLDGLNWLVSQLDGNPAVAKPIARVPLLPKPTSLVKPSK